MRDAGARFAALAGRLNLPLVGIVVVAALVAAHFTLRISNFIVMTDELQYTRLGISLGDTLSPIPHIHGQYFASFAQVYPILLSPFLHFMDMPHAWRAMHALNAVLMASTAIPAYLLAREVVRSRATSWFVAAASVAVPWMVLSTTLLTEVAAYPVFAWTSLAIYRAVVAPSARRDLVVVGALALAFFTRPQFVSLPIVLALCVLAVELRFAPALAGRLGRVRGALASIWRLHRVLIVALGIVLLFVAYREARGTASGLLGTYSSTTSGSLMPSGVWRLLRGHIDYIVVGIGLLPGLLAAAWAFPSLVRPRDRRAHAFAALLVFAVLVISYEAAVFNEKFTPGAVIQDRYNFFVVPLIFVGMAACLLDARRRTGALAVSGVVLAVLIGGAEYRATLLPFFASPDTVFHRVIGGRVYSLGKILGFHDLAPSRVLVVVTLLLTALAVWAFARLPRRSVALVACGAVLVYTVVETIYVFRDIAPARAKINLTGADSIDRAVPGDASVGVVPTRLTNADAYPIWWSAELWNKQVRYSYSLDGSDQFTPFPRNNLYLDWANGRLRADRLAPYLVVHERDVRFRPQGTLVPSHAQGYEIYKALQPYRAAWATRGLSSAGWSTPGKRVTIRLYPRAGARAAEERIVTIRISATPGAAPRTFTLSAGRARRHGKLEPSSGTSVSIPVCVGATRPTDVVFDTEGATGSSGLSELGLLAERLVVETRQDDSRCASAGSRIRATG